MSEAIAGTIAVLMLIAFFGSVAIIIAWREEFNCNENVRATYRELRTIYTSDPEKGRWKLFRNKVRYTPHKSDRYTRCIGFEFTTPWGMIAYYFGLYCPETRKQRNTQRVTTILKITEDVRDRAKTHADDELAKARAEIKELREKLSSSSMSQDKAWQTSDAYNTIQTARWNKLHNMADGTAAQRENK